MAFPLKFKALLETKRAQVEEPTLVWITYAVCGMEQDSCGWGGWILEAAKGPSGNLPAYTDQVCPQCGKVLFRTAASVKFEPSDDQTPELVPGIDYEKEPREYE